MKSAIVLLSLVAAPMPAAISTVAAQESSTTLEASAKAAEAAGRLQEALDLYVRAVQALADPPPVDDDIRLREHAITLASRLQPRPTPPEGAERFTVRGQLMFKEATGRFGFEAAAAELRKAVRTAPWVPEFAFNLALVQEKLEAYGVAAGNLKLYLLSGPTDAAPIRAKMYELELRKERVDREAEAARQREDATRPAIVHFVREKVGFFGPSLKRVAVYSDSELLGELENGTYFAARLSPGKHALGKENVADALAINIEPRHEYYFQVKPGAWKGHFTLVPLDSDGWTSLLSTARPLGPNHIYDARVFTPPASAVEKFQ